MAPAQPASAAEHSEARSGSPGLVVSSTSTKLSYQSGYGARIKRLQRAVKVRAHFIEKGLRDGGQRYRGAFITVTYRDGHSWDPRDISVLVDRYQQWGKARGFKVPLVWCAELQLKRMAATGESAAEVMHYHLVLWIPVGETPPFPDAQGWWKKGMSNCQWSHSPVGYICKYASKICPGEVEFPKGARLHGVAGLSPSMRAEITYALSPVWLKTLIPKCHGVARVTEQLDEWIPAGRFGPAKEKLAGGRWSKWPLLKKKFAHDIPRISSGWWRDLKTGWCFRSPWRGSFEPGKGVTLWRTRVERYRLCLGPAP